MQNASLELVTRSAAGDTDAYRQLYEEHRNAVMGFLYGMLGNREAAEDAAQETFVRAYGSLRQFQFGSKFRTWLLGIARNIALNQVRKLRTEQRHAEISVREFQLHAHDAENQLLGRELRGAIRDALLSIDSEKRAIFISKVVQGLSYEEISRMAGLSEPNLRIIVHRARAELRRRLSPYVGGS